MTTQTATDRRLDTPTCALAYFRGYERGAESVRIHRGPTQVSRIERDFVILVARKKVAREAFAAFAAGWRGAEKMERP